MTCLLYISYKEIKSFNKNLLDILKNKNIKQKPSFKREANSLDNIIGFLAENRDASMLYYIPVEVDPTNLKVKAKEYLRTTIQACHAIDLAIIPKEGLLAINNIKKRYLNMYKRYEKICCIMFEDDVIRILYDGQEFLYVGREYGITKVNINDFTRTEVVTKKMLKELGCKRIVWLDKKDDKWYILCFDKYDSYILYSARKLNDICSWKSILQWNVSLERVAISFGFLPDNSIISAVPGTYLDINGEKIKGFKEHKNSVYDDICNIDVLFISSDKVIVFYSGWNKVYYTSLVKGNRKWKVVRQEELLDESYRRLIKLVTKEAYEKVVKHLIRSSTNTKKVY